MGAPPKTDIQGYAEGTDDTLLKAVESLDTRTVGVVIPGPQVTVEPETPTTFMVDQPTTAG